VPDRDYALAAARDRGPNVLQGRTGSEPIVRLRLDAEVAGQLGSGLAGTEERAREDRVRLHALLAQPLAERPCLRAPFGRQLPELVRLAGSGLAMAHEVEAHGG